MKRYEYMTIKTDDLETLNRLGAEGWLVVAITHSFFRTTVYLKREVKTNV